MAAIKVGAPGMRSRLQHGAGFIVSGGLAFATDASILTLLTRGAALDPFSARIIAIACAMIVGFYAHRRLTFAVSEPATLQQFGKFLSVAVTASIVNYAIYAGILLLTPVTEPPVTVDPLAALVIATAISMFVSYVGLRFGVFRKPKA
jgi:putative flippase GtrA